MNEEDVRLTYRFLGHKDETNIRAINSANLRDVQNIFVYSENEFVEACRRFNLRGYNVYVGINERRRGGTKSSDVVSINAVVFDFDAIHPPGLPATLEESLNAKAAAEEFIEFVKRRRWGLRPYLAFSGNGWQIWIKIDISLGAIDPLKMEAVLKDMHKATMQDFKSTGAKVDNIGDLARVIKVMGTKSYKPTVTKDRVNKLSRWIEKPIDVEPHITWAMHLRKLASEYILTKTVLSDEPTEPLNEFTKRRYMKAMMGRMEDLFNGIWADYYRSRSEAEFALLVMMRGAGIPSKDAWALMEESKIGKWKEATDAYRRHTISKVYSLPMPEYPR